ncbi:MAG TPA: hypothetical protein VME46_24165 [Acidimicrobiales bacterium]|nr:hypothetical protein [Acidimicrobiales bacterium]
MTAATSRYRRRLAYDRWSSGPDVGGGTFCEDRANATTSLPVEFERLQVMSSCEEEQAHVPDAPSIALLLPLIGCVAPFSWI